MLTFRLAAAALALAASGLLVPNADAGCGCDKPPPPRAQIRPFVAHVDQAITIFNPAISGGARYDVLFENLIDGTNGWSRAKAAVKKDLADGALRAQLRVKVPDLGLGPCQVSVWMSGRRLALITDDNLTITSEPMQLHDYKETASRNFYRAGVDRAGNIYIALDVNEVTDGTQFFGTAIGFPVAFGNQDVVIYNEQGFLMQLLDPRIPGLFQLYAGDMNVSTTLGYWRHEFRTYKQAHRDQDAYQVSDDPNWHDNGTYHVDHDHIVVAVHGTLPNGGVPAPGATPPFQLVIGTAPQEVPSLR